MIRKWPLAFVLAVSLAGPVPARAEPTPAEMMYAMAKMMAVMMGHMMGAAWSESMQSGQFSPSMNFSSGLSGWPGMGSWPTAWNLPLSGVSPWSPGPLGFPGYPTSGWNRYGYPGGSVPYRALTGRWVGASGDLLELVGNRFRLQRGGYVLSGRYKVDDDHLLLYSPQTGGLTEYRFAYRQPRLTLRDSYGQVLYFRRPGRY